MTKKRISSLIVAALSLALSACVTQEFENDETPLVKTQTNNDEMAATRISLGLGYLKMGNMAQAKQNLKKAKRFSPDMVQVYTAYAHYYETVGEHDLTIASFEKALSLKSDDADTLNNYGVYLCRQGQTEAAEEQFLKAIAVPSYVLVAKSYENLSSCFLQKDNFVKAKMYLHKALMHSPSNSSILFQMVRLHYAMAELPQAKIYEQRFEKVTRRFTPQSLALAFKVYWKLGQRRTAKNYGAMLVKMYPQSWEAQQYLLNELELIEADNLAKRYKLTQEKKIPSKLKKRVVKLSPKKTNLAQPSFATSSVINAALTTESVEVSSTIMEQNEEPVSPNTPNTSEQNKKVVVLVASKADDNNKAVSKNLMTDANTEEAVEKKLTYESKIINQKTPEIHVVNKGDTLYGISLRYNIKIKALRRWNKLTGNKKIRISDKIYITDPKVVIE